MRDYGAGNPGNVSAMLASGLQYLQQLNFVSSEPDGHWTPRHQRPQSSSASVASRLALLLLIASR
jgi:hypothetical protein